MLAGVDIPETNGSVVASSDHLLAIAAEKGMIDAPVINLKLFPYLSRGDVQDFCTAIITGRYQVITVGAQGYIVNPVMMQSPGTYKIAGLSLPELQGMVILHGNDPVATMNKTGVVGLVFLPSRHQQRLHTVRFRSIPVLIDADQMPVSCICRNLPGILSAAATGYPGPIFPSVTGMVDIHGILLRDAFPANRCFRARCKDLTPIGLNHFQSMGLQRKTRFDIDVVIGAKVIHHSDRGVTGTT